MTKENRITQFNTFDDLSDFIWKSENITIEKIEINFPLFKRDNARYGYMMYAKAPYLLIYSYEV